MTTSILGSTWNTIIRPLRAVDVLIILYYLATTVPIVVFHGRFDRWETMVMNNALIPAFILFCAHGGTRNRVVGFVHTWYPAPMIFVTYERIHVIIESLRLPLMDDKLIAADRWLFGVDPTVWISQFASPPLTELLQIAYASFYFMMLALGVEMALRRDTAALSHVIFVILLGFVLSYAGYVTVPAVGPRLTLHDFSRLDAELPGVFLTETIRELINLGESVTPGYPDPLTVVNRDAFPSGHTQMTLLVLVLAFRYRARMRWVLAVSGILLIISTVYLRYHYVVDLLGGVVFTAITLWIAPVLYRRWEGSRRGKSAYLNSFVESD